VSEPFEDDYLPMFDFPAHARASEHADHVPLLAVNSVRGLPGEGAERVPAGS
jgi:hypothetical protein